MQSDAFENAFSSFLDSRECDTAEEVFFSALRTAFLAGWNAAGGQSDHVPENIIYLLHKPGTPNPK